MKKPTLKEWMASAQLNPNITMLPPEMKTYEINITVFVQAENATEALDTLGVEMDYLCESDNQLLAVEYPPVSEVKEGG